MVSRGEEKLCARPAMGSCRRAVAPRAGVFGEWVPAGRRDLGGGEVRACSLSCIGDGEGGREL